MVTSVTETTDGVAPRLRWSFWKDTAMAAVDGKRLDITGPFSARRSMGFIASGVLVDTASGPVSCRRPARKIVQDGDDGVCLMVLREGRGIIDQQGLGESALPTGDLRLFDLARPYAVAVPTPYRETRLYVPRDVFEARVGSIDALRGLQIPGASPLTGLFTRYLTDVLNASPAMTRAEGEAGLDGILHLLSGLVASRSEVKRRDDEALSGDVVMRLAEHHIEESLDDPEFDASRLERLLGVSRSRLYRAFSDQGGVATAIRDARLDRAKRHLTASKRQGQTMQAVAYRCGFADYPTFARAFRRRFGVRPTDLWR